MGDLCGVEVAVEIKARCDGSSTVCTHPNWGHHFFTLRQNKPRSNKSTSYVVCKW